MGEITIATLYDTAPYIYGAVMALMAGAIIAGFIADHAGTHRISLVLLVVMLIFIAGPLVPQWEQAEQKVHIVANGLAWIPLLVRPKTSRQQTIAAWFIACASVHIGFYFLAPHGDVAAIVEWFASISIDAVQAVLMLYWSGPHVGKAIRRLVRGRDAVARPAPTVRAR